MKLVWPRRWALPCLSNRSRQQAAMPQGGKSNYDHQASSDRQSHPETARLDALLSGERERGRERRRPNAPRELDLDLLLLGDLRLDTPRLTVPHPRLWSRRFVLAPLAEIAQEFAGALLALRDPHDARKIGRLALPETLPVYSPAL